MLSPASARRLSVLLTALLAAVALVGAGAASARAGEATGQPAGGNLVIFGDSVVADPPLDVYFANEVGSSDGGLGLGDELSGVGLSSEGPGIGSFGSSAGRNDRACPTSLESFAVQAARQLNLAARDYSCAGATVLPRGSSLLGEDALFSDQVDRALADGALDAGTGRVLINIGFNDTYSNTDLSHEELTARFVAEGGAQIKRIRAAVPDTRIQIVGYPTILGGDTLCLVHAGGISGGRVHFPLAGAWERQAQDLQLALADATGVEFLDLKPSTADNGMCAPDDRRMWAGVIDVSSGPTNLPFHANARGHAHIADFIVAS